MLRTPLYNLHLQLGAKMVEFAGWEMPLLYRGIVPEHQHTRQAASIFDVSHMGRLEFRGPDAEELLQRICTRQLHDMAPGQSRYSHVCHERGGVIDDVIVSRYEDHWLMVCNGSNRPIVLAWLKQHQGSRDVAIADITEATMMVAIQGPQAIPRLSQMLPLPIAALKRYRFLTGDYGGMTYTVFRSGYTGEDGLEAILPAMAAPLLTGLLAGEEAQPALKPAGLGARDTLRIEAGLPLYGHELDDKIDPLSAGMAWCVDLKKDFIGAEPIRKIAEVGSEYQLIGLELEGRRIARQGSRISRGEEVVGRVTSGTLSPTLGKSIAMGYVQRSAAEPGQDVSVDVSGQPVRARIVALPFYRRT